MKKTTTSNLYENIISVFFDQKVLVIGDLMVDKYIMGDINRISPEAPVQVVDVIGEELFPGGAGNVVRNLVTLGAKVSVLSVVGNDRFGDWLMDEFDKLGLEEVAVFTDSLRPTTLKTRVVANHQQILRIDKEERRPIGIKEENMIIDFLKTNIKYYDVILVSDYAKGVVTEKLMQTVISLGAASNVPVIIDPKGIEWTKYTHADVISPNEKEIIAMHKVVFQEEMKGKKGLERIGKYLLDKLRLKALLVTLGEKGMVLFDVLGVPMEMYEISAKTKAVFDVTGAGDTALSVFGLAVAAGAEYFEAAQLANFAALIVVEKVGTSSVNCEELLKKVMEA